MRHFAVLLVAVLVLAGCGHRGSLPGHDGGSQSHGDVLGSALVWLDLVCLVGAGMSAAAALFVASTLRGFAGLMWAVCFGFLFTLGGSIFLGILAPALPWIVGGLAVLGLAVLGLHYRKRVVALVEGEASAPVAPPVVAPALPIQA